MLTEQAQKHNCNGKPAVCMTHSVNVLNLHKCTVSRQICRCLLHFWHPHHRVMNAGTPPSMERKKLRLYSGCCYSLQDALRLTGKSEQGWKDSKWSLDQIVQLVANLDARFSSAGPFTVFLHTVYSMFEVKSALERVVPLAGYVVAEFFMAKVQSEHNLALVKATLHFMRFLMCVPLSLLTLIGICAQFCAVPHGFDCPCLS